MKKNRKVSKLMLFASTGALVWTAPAVVANDSEPGVERSTVYQSEKTVEVQSDAQLNAPDAQFDAQIISEPSGAERRSYSTQKSTSSHVQSFGRVHKASDIIGMEVRNGQDEKLGDIKDVMVDLRSGRVPFAVIATEGMGDRLIAVPPSALTAQRGDQLVLNMDRERLRSAPSFERNQWPNMASQQWRSDVYRFYGAEPYWQSGSYGQPYQGRTEYHQESWVSEPAGAPIYHDAAEDRFEDSNTLDDINKGSNTRGGAEDLQRFDEKANLRRGFTSPMRGEPAGAGRGMHHRETKTTRYMSGKHTDVMSMGHLHRASDLIGMNVKNAQNETVGEIKDVIVDLNSGHVAYTVVSADRYLDTRNELVAIPPSVYSYSADNRTLMLDANRNVLMNAPRFQRDNWSQVSNERFTSRVYSHYGQQPYWQAQGFHRGGTQFSEPSGAESQYQQNYQRQEFQQQQNDEFQNDSFNDESINEPSGAQSEDLELQRQETAPAISEPSGAEPQSQIPDEQNQQNLQQDQSLQQDQPSQGDQSLQREVEEPSGAELQQEPERAISEPSGAQPTESSPEVESNTPETESGIESSSSEVESSQTQSGTPSAGFEAEAESEVTEPAGAQPESQDQQSQSPEAAQQDATSTSEQEVSEPAGAAVETETQTESQDVDEAAGAAAGTSTGDQSQAIEEQVRSTLSSSGDAQDVQVTSESGKIVLRGTVQSESEKQQIEQKAQEALIDNQIQVKSSSEAEVPNQP